MSITRHDVTVGRNSVGTHCEMAFRDEISAKPGIAKQLPYEEFADMKQLEVADLKLLCEELRMKFGAATKAELVGRLLSWW